jgi:hypothetical protein
MINVYDIDDDWNDHDDNYGINDDIALHASS